MTGLGKRASGGFGTLGLEMGEEGGAGPERHWQKERPTGSFLEVSGLGILSGPAPPSHEGVLETADPKCRRNMEPETREVSAWNLLQKSGNW